MYFEAPPEDEEERKLRMEMITNHSNYCATNTYYTNGHYLYADNEQCVDEEDMIGPPQSQQHYPDQYEDEPDNFVVVSALVSSVKIDRHFG